MASIISSIVVQILVQFTFRLKPWHLFPRDASCRLSSFSLEFSVLPVSGGRRRQEAGDFFRRQPPGRGGPFRLHHARKQGPEPGLTRIPIRAISRRIRARAHHRGGTCPQWIAAVVAISRTRQFRAGSPGPQGPATCHTQVAGAPPKHPPNIHDRLSRTGKHGGCHVNPNPFQPFPFFRFPEPAG